MVEATLVEFNPAECRQPRDQPRIERRMGKNWSVMIGHGCHSPDEMKLWVKEWNLKAGMNLYRINGLPPKPKPEPKPHPPALNPVERIIAERTLGLDHSNAVCQNTFIPADEIELKVVRAMVEKDWMAEDGDRFFLRAVAIGLLNEVHPLILGILS